VREREGRQQREEERGQSGSAREVEEGELGRVAESRVRRALYGAGRVSRMA
jgi:hypothetical protein